MNMKNSLALLFIAITLSVTTLAGAATTMLAPLWEVTGLKNPESVIYDAQRDVLYVSNVDGNPPDQDGKGSIARVSADGKMLEPEWIGGLNAPKGMALRGAILYVADIDTLVEIDTKKGRVTKKYPAAQAKFLNDVTIDRHGDVYVSDMLDNAIYRLTNGTFELWLKDDALQSPNGLHAEQERLVVGAWGVITEGFNTKIPGHLKIVSFQDKRVTGLGPGTPVGNLDGVEADGRGAYYVTDWVAGKLLRIHPSGEAELLLDLAQGSADLTYVQNKHLLLIPMMSDNKLLAFKAP